MEDVVSTTKVLKLQANYSRTRVSGSYLVDGFGGALVPQNFNDVTNGSFTFDLNARGASLMSASELANVQRQVNLVGSLDAIHGNHTLVFGADYRRLSPTIASNALEESLLFNGVPQAISGVTTRLNHLAHISPQTPVFHNLSLFAQDKWRQTSRFTLTYGARWELNPAPEDPALGRRLWETTYANFAPRVSFAYELWNHYGAQTILRGGAGISYDTAQQFAGDAFVDSVPFLSGTSIGDGSVLPAGGGLPLIGFDRHLKLPYTLSWNVSLQRELGTQQSVEVIYVASAARRLLSTQTLFDTDPQSMFLRLVTNRADSNYRSLRFVFHRPLANGLKSMMSYTLARSTDDVTDDSARRVLFASANAEADRGPSDFDVRHTVNGFLAYEIPAPFALGIGNKLLRNWTVESLVNLRSAKPVNVLYGFPTTYGFAYVRPNLTGEPLYLFDGALPGGWRLNPSAFEIPSALSQGDFGRNSLRGFPFYQVDLALRRRFNFSEYRSLQFQADVFNLLNHPNFEDPLGRDLHLNSTFGQSTALAGRGFESFNSAGGPRTLRFSLKLAF